MIAGGVSSFPFFEWRWFGLFVCCLHLVTGCAQTPPETSHILETPPEPQVKISLVASKHEERLNPPFSLAILPFEDYSHHQELAWLKHGLPDMLITDLSGVDQLHLVSRYRLGEVLREQLLQHRGTFEETPTIQIGRLTGARYLLGGSFYLVHPNLVIEVHLLDVEKGSVVRALRATGATDTIPALELELSRKIARWFDSEYHTSEQPQVQDEPTDISMPDEMVPSSPPLQEFLKGEQDRQEPQSVHTTPFVKMDSLLGLEQSNILEDHIHTIVALIWERGLSIQLGRPEYPLVFKKPVAAEHSPGLLLPVSLSTRPEELQKISEDLRVVVRKESGTEKDIVVHFDHEDPAAQQLFIETFLKPRRMFVRALDHKGKVLGVYSRWEWKTEEFFQIGKDGSIHFPSSTSPFLETKAAFSHKLVAGLRTIDQFDVVMVPVQEEHRRTVVEVVEQAQRVPELLLDVVDDTSQEAQKLLEVKRALIEKQGEKLREAIHRWIQDHWAPPITESIPIPGYLPRNRQRAVVLVSEMNGNITPNHLQQISVDHGFANSIREVLTGIPLHCFPPCSTDKPHKGSMDEPREFRIQFELVKDVTAVGFNR